MKCCLIDFEHDNVNPYQQELLVLGPRHVLGQPTKGCTFSLFLKLV